LFGADEFGLLRIDVLEFGEPLSVVGGLLFSVLLGPANLHNALVRGVQSKVTGQHLLSEGRTPVGVVVDENTGLGHCPQVRLVVINENFRRSPLPPTVTPLALRRQHQRTTHRTLTGRQVPTFGVLVVDERRNCRIRGQRTHNHEARLDPRAVTRSQPVTPIDQATVAVKDDRVTLPVLSDGLGQRVQVVIRQHREKVR